MLIVSLLCLNWITGMTLADKSMFCCASNEEEIMDLFSLRLFPCHLWIVLSSCIKGHTGTYVRLCKRLHLLWIKWPFVIKKKKKNIKSWNVDSSQSRSHTKKKSVVRKGIYLDIKKIIMIIKKKQCIACIICIFVWCGSPRPKTVWWATIMKSLSALRNACTKCTAWIKC